MDPAADVVVVDEPVPRTDDVHDEEPLVGDLATVDAEPGHVLHRDGRHHGDGVPGAIEVDVRRVVERQAGRSAPIRNEVGTEDEAPGRSDLSALLHHLARRPRLVHADGAGERRSDCLGARISLAASDSGCEEERDRRSPSSRHPPPIWNFAIGPAPRNSARTRSTGGLLLFRSTGIPEGR